MPVIDLGSSSLSWSWLACRCCLPSVSRHRTCDVVRCSVKCSPLNSFSSVWGVWRVAGAGHCPSFDPPHGPAHKSFKISIPKPPNMIKMCTYFGPFRVWPVQTLSWESSPGGQHSPKSQFVFPSGPCDARWSKLFGSSWA